MHIIRQLHATDCRAFKKTGFWTTHYTMTLWDNEEQLKAFAQSGAHLEAMQQSRNVAKEIRTLTIDSTELPNWQEAKQKLQKAKAIRF
jgi:heme-degrading monooxygenase HmoA